MVVSKSVLLAIGVTSPLFSLSESISFAGSAASFLGNQNEDVDETELMQMQDKVVLLEEDREQHMRCIAMAMQVT